MKRGSSQNGSTFKEGDNRKEMTFQTSVIKSPQGKHLDPQAHFCHLKNPFSSAHAHFQAKLRPILPK